LAKAAKLIIDQQMKQEAQFEKKYNRLLRREDNNPGDLVIAQNLSTFKSHNCKHKAQYLGPMEVDRKTLGGSYVLKDLNGAVNQRGVAAYRLFSYYSRGAQRLDRIEKVGDVSEQGSENHSENGSIYSDEEED
jgi:hypothetical protein